MIGFAVVPGTTGVWTIPCQSHPSGPALSMAKAAHSLVIVVQRPARRMFAAEILVQLGELLQMILSNSSVRKRSIAARAELIAWLPDCLLAYLCCMTFDKNSPQRQEVLENKYQGPQWCAHP